MWAEVEWPCCVLVPVHGVRGGCEDSKMFKTSTCGLTNIYAILSPQTCVCVRAYVCACVCGRVCVCVCVCVKIATKDQRIEIHCCGRNIDWPS